MKQDVGKGQGKMQPKGAAEDPEETFPFLELCPEWEELGLCFSDRSLRRRYLLLLPHQPLLSDLLMSAFSPQRAQTLNPLVSSNISWAPTTYILVAGGRQWWVICRVASQLEAKALMAEFQVLTEALLKGERVFQGLLKLLYIIPLFNGHFFEHL